MKVVFIISLFFYLESEGEDSSDDSNPGNFDHDYECDEKKDHEYNRPLEPPKQGEKQILILKQLIIGKNEILLWKFTLPFKIF